MIESDNLAGLDGVAHAFFTRCGGVSAGLYESLNCGPGSRDIPTSVAENRARAVARLGFPPAALTTVHQRHTADCVVVDGPWRADPPVADALATAAPGVVLGVLTADCAPVLFADPRARVVGAAHAGWKGALGGVVEATVAAMESLGARRADIRAAVGPCIAQPSYEVGPDFPIPFLDGATDAARFFSPAARAGHHLFDLPGYVLSRLRACGVGHALACGPDTYAEGDRFFSFRRATHRGEADYGRQLSAIALTGGDAR